MKKVGFDQVQIDPQGNVIGYMGTGDRIIAYDAHIDTVGIGNLDNWDFDPYEAGAFPTSAAALFPPFTGQKS